MLAWERVDVDQQMLNTAAYGERTRIGQLVCCTKDKCRDDFQPTTVAGHYLTYIQRRDPACAY